MLHFKLKLNENQTFSYTPDTDEEIFVLVKRANGDVESMPVSSERSLCINAGDILMFESYDSVPDFVINAVNAGVAEALDSFIATEPETT